MLEGDDRFLSVGTDGFGIRIDTGTIRLATIAPAAPPVTTPPTEPDARRWIAVEAENLSAELELPGDALNASVSGLGVKVNRGSGGALALDWTKAVDTNEAGPFATTPVEVGEEEITLATEILAVSGGMHIDIADFVVGDADFALESTLVAVDLPGLQPDIATASLMTIGLSNTQLRIGPADGAHFSVEDGDLVLALLKPSPATPNPADTRSWTALKGTVGEITLTGFPSDFGLTIVSLGLEVNRATGGIGGANLATPLDWTAALNLDRDASFGEDPDDRVIVNGEPLELKGDLLRATGIVDVDLFDFVTGRVGFAFESRTIDIDLDANGTVDLTDAKLTTIGLAILPEEGLDIGAGGIGFHIDGGTLAVAQVKPVAVGDQRSWMALTAALEGGTFTGIDGLGMTIVELGVEINKGANGATVIDGLDWSTEVGSAEPGGFSRDARHRADPDRAEHHEEPARSTTTARCSAPAASSTIDIFGFVSGRVGFTFETLAVDAMVGGRRSSRTPR